MTDDCEMYYVDDILVVLKTSKKMYAFLLVLVCRDIETDKLYDI